MTSFLLSFQTDGGHYFLKKMNKKKK